jgi:hypothetical protein
MGGELETVSEPKYPPMVEPVTGVVVDVTHMSAVAESLERLREVKNQINDAIGYLTDAVIAESRNQGTKTLNAGAVTLELSTGYEIEWDVGMLDRELSAAGLPPERLADVVVPQFTWKVNAAVARQLAAANDTYKTIIEAAQTRIPKPQYVKVKR